MPSNDFNRKLVELLEPFMRFLPFTKRKELRNSARGYAGGKAASRNRQARLITEKIRKSDEISKAEATEIQKALNPDNIALLMEAGPPAEWSGGVVGALGKERATELAKIFKAMRFEERRFIREKFKELFSDDTTREQFDKAADEFRDKFNIEPIERETEKAETSFEIIKRDDEQRLVTGLVLVPDVVDSQGDTINEGEIFKSIEFFMLNSPIIAEQHQKNADGSPIPADVKVIEIWQARTDFELNGKPVEKGSWVMTVKVFDDELWKKVKKGETTGFSIRGEGLREQVSAMQVAA